MTAAQIAALDAYEQSDAFSEDERLALRYADAMTSTPVEVADALFAALRERLGPKALVELTAAIAWENYRARMNHALGAEAEGYSEGAACAVPVRAPRAV